MSTPNTPAQIPAESILDYYNKQCYLGNGWAFTIPGVSIPTTDETPVALISNPTLSGTAFPQQKALFISLRRISSLSDSVQIKFYIASTITSAGTPATPVNLRPASSNTSVSVCTTSPTVTDNGTLIDTLESPVDYYISEDAYRLIILDPGQSLLITCTAASATTININLGWYEL